MFTDHVTLNCVKKMRKKPFKILMTKRMKMKMMTVSSLYPPYILKGFRLKNSNREKGGFDDISAPKTKKSRNSAN